MSTATPRRATLVAIAAAALLGGTAAAVYYSTLGLTLSHYDARGHLVVARRIVDSITPGWQQIGAVWLPLPHLLNAIPVQIDAFFTSGASAVALSVISFAVATAGIAWLVASLTGSWFAGVASTAVFALNPSVLYLQATPMTEPLLLALTVGFIGLLVAWCARVGRTTPAATRGEPTWPSHALVGWTCALACLTRYEAWPVTFAALAASAWVLWRTGQPPRAAILRPMAIAAYPAAAILGFTLFSRVVVGSWFASGFFVPENPALGHPVLAARQIAQGLVDLSGVGVLGFACAGATLLLARAVFARGKAAAALPLALATTAAVPWVAFLQGHPYRVRYMVPLIAAQAVFAGVAAASHRRIRPAAITLLLVVAGYELDPLDKFAPMAVEAQRDEPSAAGREAVTACLRDGYGGETIMASMGSLGHYMQRLSGVGFTLRDFLHEGNGDIWLNALDSPRPFVGWILMEEEAEGGDLLASIARARPGFLEGFTRACEGGGLALYQRRPSPGTSR